MGGSKSTAESHEWQQILTISEENAFAECVTRLAILEHPLKHPFIRELAEKIRSSRWQPMDNSPSCQLTIGNT